MGRHRHFGVLAAVLAVAGGLGGCASDVNPVRDVFVSTGLGAQPVKRPDFVEQSRPQTLEYRPVGDAPPARATAAKPKAGVQLMEAEMNAARAANEARGAEARQAGAASTPPQPQKAE